MLELVIVATAVVLAYLLIFSLDRSQADSGGSASLAALNQGTPLPLPEHPFNRPKDQRDEPVEWSRNDMTYNTYEGDFTRWRSAGMPHAPMTFRPTDQTTADFGSDNDVQYDMARQMHYFPHLHYDDYGMYHVPENRDAVPEGMAWMIGTQPPTSSSYASRD